MYEYNPLDIAGLKQIGIAFETDEESNAFAALIREELEIRIGEAISAKLTEEQLNEYDALYEQEATSAWLGANCPDYRKIVQEKAGELKSELLRHRKSIDGLDESFEMRVNSLPIAELKLTPHGRSYNCLKHAGIDTIGELRKVVDLSQIRNLTPACEREINEKLNEYLASLPSAEEQDKDICFADLIADCEDE